jgi:hypothetical protein
MGTSGHHDSLHDLFKQKGLDSQFPVYTKKLATDDITIPNLRKAIRFGELAEAENMIASMGGTWDQYPKMAGPNYKKGATIQNSPGKLYVEEPAGGFTNAEKLELNAMDRRYDYVIPEPIRQNFKGLTDLEARIAYGNREAIGARLVEEKDNPALIGWLNNAASVAGIETPRLVIVESDIPQGLAMSLPRIPGTIFISSNMTEILTENQLKAVIGHEIGHIAETLEKDQKNLEPKSMKQKLGGFLKAMSFKQPLEDVYAKEFRADGYGAMLTSATDMASALLAVDDRMAELAKFSTRLNQSLKESGIPLKDLPGYFAKLTSFEEPSKANAQHHIDSHKGDAKKGDTHPPTDWRIDRINKGTYTPAGFER